MKNKLETADKRTENQPLRAALTQMSDAELKRLRSSIDALQTELSRLTPLLRTEPVEVVTTTQSLLKILNDEIVRIFVIKQMKDSRNRIQEWDNEGGRVDYAPAYHLLRQVNGARGCLMWTDIGQVKS